ncbi:MAG: hypothetical protein EOO59_14660 [Hymenobacter sp.]|nr:MAG: hypothetical protein EOO59_14660 [Hymenobacter sp.]
MVVPALDDAYFPVVVGTYRSYAVQDTTWTNGTRTVSQYQLRERVAEQFSDAAGQPAYRLVRSRRADAAANWVDDSIFTVQPLARAVLLTQGNVRTVELIYPPQAGKAWNAYAFTVGSQRPDTISNLTRAYGPTVAQAYTTPAAGAAPAKTYDAAVLTRATLAGGAGQEDVNVYTQRGLRQVYARGVGRVLRRRFYYETFLTDPLNGAQNLTPGVVQNGRARRETLLETGRL